ncbi:MAG: helix-turn-helix transcriptional regulator [Bacillota bacterium]|nr:helix-turn-helix transcriptional regulator [Bacillota bacterium]
MNYKELGKNIRILRKKQKLTIEQLSEKCDISSNFLGKIERAQSIPSLDTIVAIANSLNVGVDDLIKGDLAIKNTEMISNLGLDLSNLPQDDQKSFAELCYYIAQYYIDAHKKAS